VDLPAGLVVFFVLANAVQFYVLVAGTDAESSPDVIRPDDYAAGTNEKVWKLASTLGSGGSGSAAWGDITGTLANQTDLQEALDAKADTADLGDAAAKDVGTGSGDVAAGIDRPASPARTCRKDLARFLNEAVSAPRSYDTLWTVPNRKLLAVYPQVILPTYETKYWWDILMAIDTSGSVPEQFISVALAFARQPHRPDSNYRHLLRHGLVRAPSRRNNAQRRRWHTRPGCRGLHSSENEEVPPLRLRPH